MRESESGKLEKAIEGEREIKRERERGREGGREKCFDGVKLQMEYGGHNITTQ